MVKLNAAYLFLIAFVALIFLPSLFMKGMFMDGLLYSGISKNVAQNFYNHFHFQLSATMHSDFHEQPPLAFYTQGLFFKTFGNYFFVDRLYSFFCLIFCLVLVHKIAREFTNLKSNAWAAIVCFLSVPVVSWCFKNGMLENTMCIFCLAAIYVSHVYFTSQKFGHATYVFFMTFFTLCSFLCKGFTGIFPIAAPILYYYFVDKSNKKLIVVSVAILLLSTLIFGAIFFLVPSFRNYFVGYFNTQFFASINGTREVDGHFFILKRLPQELLILIIGTLLFHLKYKTEIIKVLFAKVAQNGMTLYFLVLGISASLPIMISPKQSGYYVLCAYPFYAIFFSLINYDEFEKLKLKSKSVSTKNKFKIVMRVSIFISVALSIFNFGSYYRDEQKIVMVNYVANYYAKNKQMSIGWELDYDYSLYGYFARLHNVSLYTPNYKLNPNSVKLCKHLEKDYTLVKSFCVGNETYFLAKQNAIY